MERPSFWNLEIVNNVFMLENLAFKWVAFAIEI